jgi:aminopeptidase
VTEPLHHLLEKYARLVVRIGVNVQPGQEVVITALPEQADTARAIMAEAYRVGASRVSIDYQDPYVLRQAVLDGPEEMLGVAPDHQLQRVRAWHESKPAVVNLTGNPFPGLMEGLDPSRLARSQPMEVIQEVAPLMLNATIAWTVVGAPTQGWAESMGLADVAELWEAVAHAMRLDEADPEAVWRAHIAKLKRREQILNAHAFDRVRYQGPGTDVTIGLMPGSVWRGGSGANEDGVEFVPNLPTEEVFISPDWRRAEGVVRTTAPFNLMGTIVEDLELELRDGEIVGAKAAHGEAQVQAQFEHIPRARYLGEVAIVDSDSRVADTGLVFKDMLYDENVGSHIAWGMGFAFSHQGAMEKSPQERIESGLNQSGTHVDIVVGSPEVQIDGIHADGSVVPVTRGDEFVLTD